MEHSVARLEGYNSDIGRKLVFYGLAYISVAYAFRAYLPLPLMYLFAITGIFIVGLKIKSCVAMMRSRKHHLSGLKVVYLEAPHIYVKQSYGRGYDYDDKDC